MKSLFLKQIEEKSIQRMFKDILDKPMKRKLIYFDTIRCDSVIQFGMTFSIGKPDRELIESRYGKYECYSIYIEIDLGWFGVGITVMDYN